MDPDLRSTLKSAIATLAPLQLLNALANAYDDLEEEHTCLEQANLDLRTRYNELTTHCAELESHLENFQACLGPDVPPEPQVDE
jgi:hypothetical protein